MKKYAAFIAMTLLLAGCIDIIKTCPCKGEITGEIVGVPVKKKEYILPKTQPRWDGMIVRCEVRQENVVYWNSEPPCKNDKCQCHWECEFGVATETIMDGENQIIKPSGCSEKAPSSNNNRWGFINTQVAN